MVNRPPFGNAYIIDTPKLDQLSDRIYNEQRQRELYQQQQNKMLDDEFSRELAGIRRADVDELSQAYQDYKAAYNNFQKMGKRGTTKAQFDLLEKKAKMYSLIQGSKEQKDLEKQVGGKLLSKPDLLEDGAHEKLRVSMATPLSKLGDLANYDYSYKGTDFNMQDAERKAAGSERISYSAKKDIPLGKEITNYKFGNTPAQFKESMIGMAVTNKGGRAASAIWDNMPQNIIEQVNKEYEAITPEKWEQMTGSRTPQNLDAKNPYNKAEQLAAHQAKLYAINARPSPQTEIQKYDKSAIMDRTEAFQLKKQKISHQNSLLRLREMIAARGNDPDVVNRNVDESIVGDIEYTQEFGEVPMAADKFKVITGVDKSKNSYIKTNDNGDYEYGIKDKDGKPVPGGKVTRNDAQFKLTKGYRTGLSGNYNSGKNINVPKPKKVKYLADGVVYDVPENEVKDFLKDFPKATKQ